MIDDSYHDSEAALHAQLKAIINSTVTQDIANRDALLNAIDTGNLEQAVALRVHHQRSVDIETNQIVRGCTLLHLCRNVAMVEYLLSKGADINAIDSYHNTPLEYAAERNDSEIVRYLLSKNAHYTETFLGKMLCNACSQNNKSIVDFLLVELRHDFPVTVLNIGMNKAISLGRTSIVELLLDVGADANSKNHWNTPGLIAAVKAARIAIVKLLLAKQANTEVTDSQGKNALFYAVSRYHWDKKHTQTYYAIIEALLASGADSTIYRTGQHDYVYSKKAENSYDMPDKLYIIDDRLKQLFPHCQESLNTVGINPVAEIDNNITHEPETYSNYGSAGTFFPSIAAGLGKRPALCNTSDDDMAIDLIQDEIITEIIDMVPDSAIKRRKTC
jgi:hypothetical protein